MQIQKVWNVITATFGGKKETFIFLAIFLLAIILRFANYTNRFGLAADQARDILIAREALRMHILPLIGPFSASGPFIFGPYWYWIFMLPVFLFPNSFIAPWVFQTLLFVFAVYISFLIGKELYGSKFGLLFSFFTAISTSEIKLSTNIIFSALVGFLSFPILYFFIRYIKTKRFVYLSFLSIIVSVAINIHFEALPLIFFLILAIIFGKRNITHAALATLFFLIPFIPLVLFNFQSHNFELSHITTLHQQIPRSVGIMTFIRAELGPVNFFPRVWGDTIGGSVTAGWILILSFILFFFSYLVKGTQKESKILLILFACMVIAIVAYEGRIFENFLGYLFTFMILFTSMMCYQLTKINKYIGVVLISVITLLTIVSDSTVIINSTNDAMSTAQFWEKSLTTNFPTSTFAIYNYTNINNDKSLPLSLLLDVAGKVDDNNGIKIGTAFVGAPLGEPVIETGPDQLRLYNLGTTADNQLKKEGFTPESAAHVYASVEDWYK